MNTNEPLPADQPARSAIVERLDENLVVEAGAGTGKTRSLVERVTALVTTGAATMDGVAAITFTEAAAAELRERIRQSLEQAASASTTPSAETKRCLQAVEDLDQGAIQTLHGFAASLLRQRPLEAGLPPGFETLDATQSDMAFEDRWSRWLDAALEDPEAQEALRPALVLGLELRHLREIAAQFHENYDLLASVSFSAPPIPGPAGARALVDARPRLEFLSKLAKSPDALSAHVENVVTLARRMETSVSDPLEAYRLLAQSPPVGSKSGRQTNWNADPDSRSNGAAVLKDLLQDLQEQITDNLADARAATLGPVLELLRSFALDYARHRKADGVAEFHDLLVWARDLLRDDLDARDYFRGRYSHVLIDEMQDTDPLQAEIAMFLAEDARPEAPPTARPRHWTEVKPGAGRIFLVGDPKQSIYRFRRADVQLMRRAQEIVGAERLVLSQNFRSRPGVIDWVNYVFGNWMQPWLQPDMGQPAYLALKSSVEDWADGAGDGTGYGAGYSNGTAPAVRYIGDAVDARIGRVRREEATAIATTILSARREGWPVRAESGDGAMRATDFRDICILMPTRTGLDVLELALEDAGIPYRLESQSMIYETQEIRDLLNCLRAIDDPTDQISVVAALRSPAFACSDVDLLAFIEAGAQEAGAQEAGGQFDYLGQQTGPPGHVWEAFAALKEFHARRRWVVPSALIEEFVRCRRLMEAALGERRPRERWRRYRFLIDHARAFAIVGGASLRAFLDWTGRQQLTNARVMETSVPELDEDAVRVMTVHGAKGLEFPTVILTGLNSRRQHRPGPVLFDWREGNVEARVGRQGAYFQTGGYDDLSEADKLRDDEEFVRLLYVAATRARDHLIVSRYRDSKDNNSAAARIAGFLQGADDLWGEAVAHLVPSTATDPDALDNTLWADTASLADDTAEVRREWAEERQRVYWLRAQPHSVAVTGLANQAKKADQANEADQADKAKEEQDIPDEPWKRGRAGTNIGRAVHAVLQTVDMETGHGLEDIAKAQAAAEGVPDRSAEIARLARHALSSGIVKRALGSGRWWRETPVAGPAPPEIDAPGVDSPGIVEGFIDLLFEEEDGFVIVDYKTDALRSVDDIDRAMKQYRLQGGGYAFALERAVGARVKEVCFLFLQPQQEKTVEDLPSATQKAEQAALARLAGE